MKIELRTVPLPPLDIPVERPEIPTPEYEARCRALLTADGLDWVAVYGDREHFANLAWLTGYDPRFEEALLLLGPGGKRVLLVGIEGVAYASIAGLPLEVHHYHPFSIIGQPHTDTPSLAGLLQNAGLRNGDRVGIAGWKTADPREIDAWVPAFVPAFLVRALDEATGASAVDVTSSLIDPARGLRVVNSAAQIAQFEWGAARAGAAVLRVVAGVRPGMTELDAAGLFGLQGEPCTMHPIVSASSSVLNGLRSASSRPIEIGDAITAGVGFRGGLCCRAGVMTETPDSVYWTNLAEPYFRAIAAWWSTAGIGVTAGELDAAVRGAIGNAPWQSFVNAGHLTGHDEWLYGFSLPGSEIAIRSGMAMQCDIIPTPLPPGQAINCEDSLAIADEGLRAELANEFPKVWARIEARRAFMTEQLGIPLRPEVLPLGAAPAYLSPCWLQPERVFVVAT
jgi:hypothetical protein